MCTASKRQPASRGRRERDGWGRRQEEEEEEEEKKKKKKKKKKKGENTNKPNGLALKESLGTSLSQSQV